jgi:hypothetical protein
MQSPLSLHSPAVPSFHAAVPAFQQSGEKPSLIQIHTNSNWHKAKDQISIYHKLIEKYAEILKCAQNYDMEKHQRKLKRMEEKK